ncbi:MAG TPA: hypothetical protein VMU19_03310 [Bryobacteraceae bacterium]|nr:hypothetical protein [Bryobacteraceae bacterium]
MKRTVAYLLFAGLLCGSAAVAQTPAEKAPSSAAPPAGDLADGLAQRLSQELHVKTVAGQPIHAGSVTLIPILLVDVNFAGGAGPAPAAGAPPLDGFLMSGEARPVGFVAITKNGTRFLSVANTQARQGESK